MKSIPVIFLIAFVFSGCRYTPKAPERPNILFTNAYTPNAKCAPSRSSILTGRNSWQLKEAANHVVYFPAKLKTFPEVIREHGYADAHLWRMTERQNSRIQGCLGMAILLIPMDSRMTRVGITMSVSWPENLPLKTLGG